MGISAATSSGQEVVDRDEILRLFSNSSAAFPKHRQRVRRYLRRFLSRPEVASDCSVDALLLQLNLHDEAAPVPLSEYLDLVEQTIVPNSVNMASPRCMGHMTSLVPGFVWPLGEIILGLNQNLVKRDASRILTLVERQALAIMHRSVYGFPGEFYEEHAQNDAGTLGIMTSGATLANITALWIARNRALGPDAHFAGVETEGVSAALEHHGCAQAVIIASSFAHYSIQKAASVLGLGERNLISIPVDPDGRMRPEALRRAVAECRARRSRIVAIVATAGSTDCGSIDPLCEIADVARREKTHFHVDAAWGAPLLFSRRHRAELAGIDLADTVTADGHKQLYLPLGNSLLLLRDPHASRVIEKQTRYMLQECSGDLGKRSLEGSRSAAALFLHAALHVIGPAGYEVLVNDNIRRAKQMADKLASRPEFQVLVRPQTNMVLYRYIPPELRPPLEDGCLSASENQQINRLNEQIQHAQRDAGRAFVSRTTVHNLSGRAGTPVVALRAVLSNPLTTEQDIDFVLDDQVEIAAELESAEHRSRSAAASCCSDQAEYTG
jgi:putative pyridoxal-dependent aspartate 1-decarboxylase